MRKAKVYRNNYLAGELIQENSKSYVFRYSDSYYSNNSLPAISLTLPKTHQEYKSEYLFPFFFNMLSEGVNRKLQSRQLKIDEKDYFGLLLETTKYDTIGAITLKPDTE
ncbi:MAG: HipA N-terminal domain-containing protein [Bacteroidales bacterium]|jgi:serine/threonine-protein kinase HipA|nr:HipA N-terminal domain-containing protein [Bacteroidales bacterium]